MIALSPHSGHPGVAILRKRPRSTSPNRCECCSRDEAYRSRRPDRADRHRHDPRLRDPEGLPGVSRPSHLDGVENGEEDIFPETDVGTMAESWRAGEVKGSNTRTQRPWQKSRSRLSNGGRGARPRRAPTSERGNTTRTGNDDDHKAGGREEWLAARGNCFSARRSHQEGDELARQRRELPWVPGREGLRSTPTTGRGPWRNCSTAAPSCSSTISCSAELQGGCPVNSSIGDAVDGLLRHLDARDVTMISCRAPLEEAASVQRRMGWRLPWARREEPTSASTSAASRQRGGDAHGVAPSARLPPIVALNAAETGTDVVGYLAESSGVQRLRAPSTGRLPDVFDRGARGRVPDELLPDPRPGAQGRDEGDGFQTWIHRHDEYATA